MAESSRRAARSYDAEDAAEDAAPTTASDEQGFFWGSAGAEIYAVCGVGSFLPVTLEQLARERGVLRSDHTTPCIKKAASTAATVASTLLHRAAQADDDNNQCIVRPFGRDMTTSSLALYSFSVAVLCQALVLISFSSVADYGTYRKRLLLAFALSGATSSMLFILVVPRIYLVGSLLIVIGVVSLGSFFVLLNSFLPLLARHHPLVTNHPTSASAHTSATTPTTTLEAQMSARISSRGVGIGYIAAVSTQLVSIGMLFGLNKLHLTSTTLAMRLVLLLTGTLWALSTLPLARLLRDRPGPPLPALTPHTSRLRSLVAYTSFAWRSVWRTVKLAWQLPQLRAFLVAWFLLSDAIATVSGTAILFARTELHMGTVAVAALSVTATASGIAGAFLWPVLSRRLCLAPKTTIILCVACMEIIPLYGLLGYLPFIRTLGVGGLQRAWEIYPLGVVHGFVMGGLSAYCRAFYGSIVPPGAEAAFFALYAITDKGSSAVGPAVVGGIVDATGSIRPAFAFLAVLILLPMPLLVWGVDAEKGARDAGEMAARLAGREGKKAFVLEDIEGEEGDDGGADAFALGDVDEDDWDEEGGKALLERRRP